jgi:hypothetical protein
LGRNLTSGNPAEELSQFSVAPRVLTEMRGNITVQFSVILDAHSACMSHSIYAWEQIPRKRKETLNKDLAQRQGTFAFVRDLFH